MVDRATNRSRGFGFITYDSEAVVADVIRRPHELHGKAVEVKRAEPRVMHGPGPGPGQGMGGPRGGRGGRGGDAYGGGYDYDGNVRAYLQLSPPALLANGGGL